MKIILIFIFTPIIIFLCSCSSFDVKNNNSNQALSNYEEVSPLHNFNIFNGMSFNSDSQYLNDYLENFSDNKLVFSKSLDKADIRIQVIENLKFTRDKHWLMLGNIITVLVGYFYFYFDVECNADMICSINIKNYPFFEKKVLVNNISSYNYQGYLPPPPPNMDRKAFDLFYDDITDSTKDIIAQEAASKILKLLVNLSEKKLYSKNSKKLSPCNAKVP